MEKFPIASKVVKKPLQAGYSYHAGDVIAITPDGKIIVEMWAHCNFKGACNKYDPSELFTEAEAAVEQARLDADQSKLEIQFESVRGQIISKMDQAATLVAESAALAEEFEKTLSDLKPECRPLFNALKDGGWSASSMSC